MKGSILAICLVFMICVVQAQEAQWRGENRDGQFHETGLLQQWPEEGPELLFSVEDLGRGFSEPVVDRGTVYVTGRKDTLDFLTAIDGEGNVLYSKPIAPSWSKSLAEARSAPAIIDGKVLVISGSGRVVCLEAESGNTLWSEDVFTDYKGRCGEWWVAESPLVFDGKVIYTPGGVQTTMVALDLNTGETVWATESLKDTAAYVSPIAYEYAGKRVIVGMTASYVFGVDAEDGTFLWTHRYYDIETPLWHVWAPVINCISPVYHDGRLYVTSGYDHVGVMFELNGDGTDVDIVWTDTVMDCHHGGVVLIDGHIYGSNWIDNGNGNWCCIEWETGRTNYVKKWNTKGSMITSDGLLYCYEEKRGNLALVRPTPEDFEIISSFRIPEGSGPHWAHPFISGGRLVVRHGDVLMAYNIRESPGLNL